MKVNGGEMSEIRDLAIKLFGKTIQLPECHIPAKDDENSDVDCQIPGNSDVVDLCSDIIEDEDVHLEESGKEEKPSVAEDGKGEDQSNYKPREDLAKTSSVDQEKVLKKPDKLVACPRCNSLDTKFCYFNNYNVNQPRHFCKNCQRYWTAGGTMRNVHVGAGRRRNKHLASQYHQILVSPESPSRIEISDSTNQQVFSSGESPILRPLTRNGTVLKVGPEGHLCESMATVLYLRDQKSCAADLGSTRENREEQSTCGSSITASNVQLPGKVKEQGRLPDCCNELTPSNPMQCYLVPPWVFPCNQVWNNGDSMMVPQRSSELVSVPEGSDANPIQWCSTPMLAVPGFCRPSIPLQFVPASYWGCLLVWTAGSRNTPIVGSDCGFSPSSSTANSCSSNNSPILGKHSRDANFMDKEKSANCVFVPKTLRIDDLDEPSKSSIWATLGFKSNQKETDEARYGIFKPFKSNADSKGHPSDATQVLEANPAALSRSRTFQEST